MSVAIVTGAARGMGSVTARNLAALGWDIVLFDRCEDDPALPYGLATAADLDETVEACRRTARAEAVVGDVRDQDALDRVVKTAVESYGGLDAAVAAAGCIGGGMEAWHTPDELWSTLLGVNLEGAWRLANAAVPALLSRPHPRHGRFVAIASAAGTVGMYGLAAYSAAKHGVIGLVRTLAAELGPHGVTANAVAPGSTQTSMLAASAEMYGLSDLTSFAEHHLLPRLLQPEEPAALITWLCGPESSGITGAVIPVDAGDDRSLSAPTASRPLPAEWGLVLDRATTRPSPRTLIGGQPLRVLRLTDAGSSMLDRWVGGDPVGPSEGVRALAARLVDSGLAHPRPSARSAGSFVCAVIPVLDDPEGLQVTVAGLNRAGQVMALVVVDDGSEPAVDTKWLERHFDLGPVTVVRHDAPRGPAAARNAGAARAAPEAEAILFIDAGCEPDPVRFGLLIDHLGDPALGALAPRVVSRAGTGTSWTLDSYEACHSPLDLGEHEARVRPGAHVSYLPSAALMVRRAAFEEAGGFDEDLRFGEDVDLIWRLCRAGWRVRYEPRARVTHPARRRWGLWLRQRYCYGLSAASLGSRHGRLVAPLYLNPSTTSTWGLVLAGHTVLGAGVGLVTAARVATRVRFDRRRGTAPGTGPQQISTAADLARRSLAAHLAVGAALARATRRAWLPPALVVGAVTLRSRRRRGRSCSRALLVAGGALVMCQGDRRAPGWPGWRGRAAGLPLGLVDDLAYQAGVWTGAFRERSIAALLPSVSRRSSS